MIDLTLRIQIDDIEVTDDYYSFRYIIHKNDKVVETSFYESDHCWHDDPQHMIDVLHDGEAVKLALEHFLQ